MNHNIFLVVRGDQYDNFAMNFILEHCLDSVNKVDIIYNIDGYIGDKVDPGMLTKPTQQCNPPIRTELVLDITEGERNKVMPYLEFLRNKFEESGAKAFCHLTFQFDFLLLNMLLDDLKTSLIILGLPTANRFSGVNLFGTNAYKLVRHTLLPMITLHGKFKSGNVAKLLFVSDEMNSNSHIPGFSAACDFAKFFKAEIYLFFYHQAQFKKAKHLNELVKAVAESHNLHTRNIRLIHSLDLEGRSAQLAGEMEADLVCINSSGFKGLRAIFHHSHAESLIAHYEIPVLVVHDKLDYYQK